MHTHTHTNREEEIRKRANGGNSRHNKILDCRHKTQNLIKIPKVNKK